MDATDSEARWIAGTAHEQVEALADRVAELEHQLQVAQATAKEWREYVVQLERRLIALERDAQAAKYRG